jgi:hypothetical protein
MASVNTIVGDALVRIADSLTGSARLSFAAHTCLLGATGAPLAVFADNASSNPGTQVNSSEAFVVRWNNNGTQATVARAIPLPPDLDTAYPVTVSFDVFKVGATVGDATTVTFSAFVTKAGQTISADANCGCATGAVQGDATSLTKATVSRAIASADLVASLGTGGPGSLHIAFSPTSGTLGTDDFCCEFIHVDYQRRAPADV